VGEKKMRKDITVAASVRETRGKGPARRLRVAGQIPAVLYGTGGAAVSVTVSPKDVNKILHSKTGHNTIFDLAVAGGEKTPVMIIDWLHDPIKDNLLHIDLKRIDLTKKVHVKVPVHLEGEAFGVKTEGGLMDIVNREIELEVLPDDIPESLTHNVTGMRLLETLRAGGLALGERMTLVSDPELVVCHIVSIRDSAAAETPAGTAEPEVAAKKGKKEDEKAAAPAKGGAPAKAAAPAAKAPAAKKK
jgi:large subunit ribosomal protein L25